MNGLKDLNYLLMHSPKGDGSQIPLYKRQYLPAQAVMMEKAQKTITQYEPRQMLLSEYEMMPPPKEPNPVSSLHY